MCGIAGIVARQGEAPATRVERMTAELVHRGPNGAGAWAAGPAALAHRRLSVIDLSPAGAQPMHTPDGRYTLVFNGEIYNFRELADRFCRGVSWRSTSDTEVLLHVLARQGVAALPALRGMFAFALWDREQEVLLLARDPFGKKPLYYSENLDGFYFASEVKALLAGGVAAQLDPVAIVQYLAHEYVPGPRTGLNSVRQLPAGTVGRFAAGRLEVNSWWQPRYVPKHEVNFSRAAAQFDALLHCAVERRLVADVPVGLLLSGGLDSTAIGWYVQQLTAGNLQTFSVSFAEASFNEHRFAERAAAHLHTKHRNMHFGLDEFHRYLPRAVEIMDVPFADASLLPTLAVSELAGEQVTVVLDGDGSDELLLGYGTFAAGRLAAMLPLPAAIWRSLARLASRLPAGSDYFTWEFKLKQFLCGMPYPLARRHQVWLGSFAEPDLRDLLTADWQQHTHTALAAVDLPRLRGLLLEDALSYLMVVHYLTEDILVKLDRASMAASIEARTPFLDVDVADYLLRLPVAFRRNKRLLKAVMRGRIPADIIDRPKHGFALPLAAWLRGPLYAWARDVLSREAVQRCGIVRYEAVDRLFLRHRAGKLDARKQLWTLLMLQLWQERWVHR